MQYGHFDDAHKEYVIETPQTPLPWINYLGSDDFFTIVSNTAGGYSFIRTHACAGSRATATTQARWTQTGCTSISRMGTAYGTPAGSPRRPHSTAIPAATAWAIQSLRA